jgi:hypothetical protein
MLRLETFASVWDAIEDDLVEREALKREAEKRLSRSPSPIMSRKQAWIEALKLAASSHVVSIGVWFAGEVTGWEYGCIAPGLLWVQYLDGTNAVVTF